MESNRAVTKLQALVAIPTVSHVDKAQIDTETFEQFGAEHRAQFPLLHERLEVAPIHEHGMLIHWPGRDTRRPVVLMAHLDVVPVDEGAPWTHPPFSAALVDGAIWGRGTLDDKGALVAICEAVERLLEQDFTPAQDVWLSFGCDEEVLGAAAQEAVEELKQRGVEPWMVIDEGGAIASEALPGLDVPLGVVGVTEKGTTQIEIKVEGRGGHASTPTKFGPTARLAKAILKVDSSPMPARLNDVTIEMLQRLGPHTPAKLRPLVRLLAGNAERIRPLLTRALILAGPESAAMTRTTLAVTTLEGSPADNVIASTARAGINVRVMVGDTVDDVVKHLRKSINDDQVQVSVVSPGEASPVSPIDDDAFRLIEDTIGEVFPDAVPTPYVMMAATDSRHFTAICSRVYRFAPFRMTKEQRESIHSYGEHIRVDDFLAGVDFYQRLIERLPS